MRIDLDEESSRKSYDSQVCVLGAGIAGLILAHRLAGRGLTVHLLEAGGLELEPRSQQLYDVETAGDRHTGATEGRFRVFGGSSTRWGGQLLPFTEDIFRPTAGMPSAAWPIGPEAIERYYEEVLEIVGADKLPFGADLLPALGQPAVGFGNAVRLRFSKWAPFGRRNLANSLGRECLAHERITVFIHANVVSLEERGGRIASVVVKNYAGSEFRFAASEIVVCMGTIESSRLLLVSGIANASDQVGRYFHDDISVRVAAFEGEARAEVLKRLGPFFVDGTLHTCKIEASAGLRARIRLPAAMAHVVIEEPEDSGAVAVRNLLRSVQQGRLKEAVAKNLLPMIRGIGDVVRLVWGSKVSKRRAVSPRAKVWLNVDMEQVASADSRIQLSEATDAIGERKALVEWRIGEAERETARTYAKVVHAELASAEIAGLRWIDDGAMTDTYHPMGGLRMGVDPAASVVDTELRVHGIGNLSVASCAVFPAGGSSNPTFTLMALSLRLAARLTGPLVDGAAFTGETEAAGVASVHPG